jgi:cysteine desulfurase
MNSRIYADHAATTPARPEAIASMLAAFDQSGFNASSLHAEGRRAKAALDDARERVARALGAHPREIVFTGGGSEAVNLAIFGVARARRAEGRHVVTAASEHRAVLHATQVLRDDGFEVTVLPVDGNGSVEPEAFAAALTPGTVLATLMLANNELGTLHPIRTLSAVAHERDVIFHTDAVQAPGRIPLDVTQLGADLISLSAHKFYGPKGVGVLYVRKGTPLAPLVVGGGQEAGLRAGTENVAGIAGLATALELAVADLSQEAPRLVALRDEFETALRATVPGTRINAAGAERLPNISSVAFDGIDAAELLIRLDIEGVAVSTGSACAAGSSEPSHVLAAIGAPEWAARGTIRFSFGRSTSRQEVAALLAMLPWVIESVRGVEPFVGTTPKTDRSEVTS